MQDGVQSKWENDEKSGKTWAGEEPQQTDDWASSWVGISSDETAPWNCEAQEDPVAGVVQDAAEKKSAKV